MLTRYPSGIGPEPTLAWLLVASAFHLATAPRRPLVRFWHVHVFEHVQFGGHASFLLIFMSLRDNEVSTPSY